MYLPSVRSEYVILNKTCHFANICNEFLHCFEVKTFFCVVVTKLWSEIIGKRKNISSNCTFSSTGA